MASNSEDKPVARIRSGNAYGIIAAVVRALKKSGASQEAIDKYTKEAKQGDYDDLIAVSEKYAVLEW